LPAGNPDAPTGAHVLLVEDDNEVAKLACEMLAQLGFEVSWAASAKEALGALSDGHSFDIVFSDIMMPGGMSGLELARQIRSRRRELPVLLTSGYIEAARRDGEIDGVVILPKPYGLDQLSAALRTVMRQGAQAQM
jgi:CheY-like chemotaxis protein